MTSRRSSTLMSAAVIVALSGAAFGFALHSVLERGSGFFQSNLLSQPTWESIVLSCGGELRKFGAVLPLATFLFAGAVGSIATWLTGSAVGGWIGRTKFSRVAGTWGRSFRWLAVSVLPFLLFPVLLIVDPIEETATPSFMISVLALVELMGWWLLVIGPAVVAGSWLQSTMPESASSPIAATKTGRTAWASWMIAGLAVTTYVCVFTTMNWKLYDNLLIPHGDSAMYEEHIWNTWHGKGFRSYIDQGLFLGEHIQVLHLGLLPLHVIWPSHLLLELCESIALAVGAIPLFVMTKRMTRSNVAAVCLAIAWVCYFPLHFLDISIDIKTFRPISLGVPAMMFALERIEKARFKAGAIWLVVALLAKEDFAAAFAPLGIWIAFSNNSEESPSATKTRRYFGVAVAVLSVAYVALCVTTLIPAFREGEAVHYTRYFGKLGSSPSEIAKSLFTQPAAVMQRLFSLRTTRYAATMLVPLGLTCCLSPARLLVAAPLFGVLSLMQLNNDPNASEQILLPFHHFHAPLVPLIFWAAAGGLQRAFGGLNHVSTGEVLTRGDLDRGHWWSGFALASSVGMMILYSFCPLSIQFWDAGARLHHSRLYGPTGRAQRFAKVLEQIPKSARVASTDFVHTRLTHHERSYDYSNYARRVSGYELRVPDDTDFIVIDTHHHYSEIKTPEQIREYREQPDKWELLPDVSDGYFLVLKRRESDSGE